MDTQHHESASRSDDKPSSTGARPSPSAKLKDPSLYINRELSQLEFNFRVLAQARDPKTPLLERVRFLGISCSNLDEFFEIRVASLVQQQRFGGWVPGPDGMSPGEALAHIRSRALELVDEQYETWNSVLRPALEKAGIRFMLREEWSAKQRKWLESHFQKEILPVLSPLGLDPSHPFPRILNKSLNIAVVLKGKDAFGREGHMALVRAPRSLPRVIRLPDSVSDHEHTFVLLSGVLQEFMEHLFPGMQVKGAYPFRVTRNSELIVDEEEVENLAHALKLELRERGFARAVRLEITDTAPKSVLRFLIANFELAEDEIYRCSGPVNLSRVMAVYEQIERPDLKFTPFQPRIQPELSEPETLFEAIRDGDVLLHHPYDSFVTVQELMRQASVDAGVLAIKQTLYRTGADSPFVNYLVDAARAGKDVTVVIELRARFDEEANIALANKLQEAGVQVVYGVVGYKTHAKMLLIVRRENGTLNRYVHLSTGNYHPNTAQRYTDIGLLTAHPDITSDVHQMFQQLSGMGPAVKLRKILQSPFTLHKALMAKIERETAHARAGRHARIAAKINALNEPVVVRLLYEAARAGVKVELLVRSGCTLRPGIKGVSENITVRSVVGRLLEHSRVYYFENAGTPEVFCSSADWMERNLLRRIETCFPILDPELARRVVEECIENYLADNTHAWKLRADGNYERVEHDGEEPYEAQEALLEKLCGL